MFIQYCELFLFSKMVAELAQCVDLMSTGVKSIWLGNMVLGQSDFSQYYYISYCTITNVCAWV